MSKEILVIIKYKENVKQCIYYIDYTFEEIYPENTEQHDKIFGLCQGIWKVDKKDKVYFKNDDTADWCWDRYENEVLDAIVDKQLLEE